MTGTYFIELLNSPDLFTRYEETQNGRGVIASPLEYDELMRIVPQGELTTIEELKLALVKKHKVDYACPKTAISFILMVANASEERDSLGSKNITAYWRTLKKNGELNNKYPCGIVVQKRKLETEGHFIVQKGKKYFVKNYEKKLFMF